MYHYQKPTTDIHKYDESDEWSLRRENQPWVSDDGYVYMTLSVALSI